MEALAREGLTVLLKVDHERMAESSRPWTMVVTGPRLGDGFLRVDAPTMDEAIERCLRPVRGTAGWGFLDDYL